MRTTFTVNEDNYQHGIPDGVTDIIISNNLDQSLYKLFFQVRLGGLVIHGTERLQKMGLAKLHVTLPDEVTFTEIEDSAFLMCNYLMSITIPSNVTRIGKAAFDHCQTLEMVNMSQSPNLQVIDNYAFSCCLNLKQVHLPDSVTNLGDFAFFTCSSLQSVTLSLSLTTISEWAFCECKSLQTIDIPEGVTSIQTAAFSGCTSLHSIKLPQSLRTIQTKAFKACRSLFSIHIPAAVDKIEEKAFDGCWDLQNIVIPHHCEYSPSTFSVYEKGQFRVTNSMDGIILYCGQDWLKNRFDHLPLHQLYNNHTLSINELLAIHADNSSLQTVDDMNMTPIHVLSCHPSVNLEMIQVLTAKYPVATFVETKSKMFAIEMYIFNKFIVHWKNKWDEQQMKWVKFCDKENEMNKIRSLMQRGCLYTLHDILKAGVSDKFWDILLAFQGTSLSEELSKVDDVSGLFPFMTAAAQRKDPLEFAYKVAMKNPTLIMKMKK